MRTPTSPANVLIAFEGIDRAGKSTLVRTLVSRPELAKRCTSLGEFGSPIGHELERMLRQGSLSPLEKTLLFAADRAWTLEHICADAHGAGKMVLWDRYVPSAIAYRAAEVAIGKSDLPSEYVEQVNSRFPAATLNVLVDITVETSMARATSKKPSPYDAAMLEEVRSQYRHLIQASPETFTVVDGSATVDVVADHVLTALAKRGLL